MSKGSGDRREDVIGLCAAQALKRLHTCGAVEAWSVATAAFRLRLSERLAVSKYPTATPSVARVRSHFVVARGARPTGHWRSSPPQRGGLDLPDSVPGGPPPPL